MKLEKDQSLNWHDHGLGLSTRAMKPRDLFKRDVPRLLTDFFRSRRNELRSSTRLHRVASARRGEKVQSIPMLWGAFHPPKGTLQLGIGRQPKGFTCGPETLLGICDSLRLPLRNNDPNLNQIRGKLMTSWKTGTDPEAIAKAAMDLLEIESQVRSHLSISDLAGLVNSAQH
jgi:hypothetical protein